MNRRQTAPQRWLIISGGDGAGGFEAARRLRPGSGILLLEPLERGAMLRLRHFARQRRLTIISEAKGDSARVHNLGELRKALAARTPVILLSPMFPTKSHPDWRPIPATRAATLARLAGRRLVALGGMDERRYARIARLGFIGWAGISAFRT